MCCFVSMSSRNELIELILFKFYRILVQILQYRIEETERHKTTIENMHRYFSTHIMREKQKHKRFKLKMGNRKEASAPQSYTLSLCIHHLKPCCPADYPVCSPDVCNEPQSRDQHQSVHAHQGSSCLGELSAPCGLVHCH